MSDRIGDAFAGTIRFTETLDTELRGSDYLLSDQKRRLDAFGARALLFASRPLIAVAQAAVWLEDGGPTMLRLPRVGLNGEIFGEYKIRSMRVGSESDPVPITDKRADDARITRVGRAIRALSIDELPQAKNVLNGEMSLVGSRPKPLSAVEQYTALDPAFADAYTLMRPGLTGLEQINGRGMSTTEQRIELTKEYAADASLKLDRDILRKTAAVVALRHGAY